MRKTHHITSLFINAIVILVITTAIPGCERQASKHHDELKARIQRVIVEAWNEGNLEALDELYSDNFVRHRPPFPDIVGLAAHKDRVAVVRSAYPDHKTTIHDIIIDNNMVALWYTWSGTHTGEGLSIPPTGIHVAVPGCDVYRVVDGKIAEEWDHEGFLSLFQQLGYEINPPNE